MLSPWQFFSDYRFREISFGILTLPAFVKVPVSFLRIENIIRFYTILIKIPESYMLLWLKMFLRMHRKVPTLGLSTTLKHQPKMNNLNSCQKINVFLFLFFVSVVCLLQCLLQWQLLFVTCRECVLFFRVARLRVTRTPRLSIAQLTLLETLPYALREKVSTVSFTRKHKSHFPSITEELHHTSYMSWSLVAPVPSGNTD